MITNLGQARLTKTAASAVPRCRACQLQLCKSRDEPAHADLKAAEVSIDAAKHRDGSEDTIYLCQKCAAVLIHSSNLAQSGWRQQR